MIELLGGVAVKRVHDEWDVYVERSSPIHVIMNQHFATQIALCRGITSCLSHYLMFLMIIPETMKQIGFLLHQQPLMNVTSSCFSFYFIGLK